MGITLKWDYAESTMRIIIDGKAIRTSWETVVVQPKPKKGNDKMPRERNIEDTRVEMGLLDKKNGIKKRTEKEDFSICSSKYLIGEPHF